LKTLPACNGYSMLFNPNGGLHNPFRLRVAQVVARSFSDMTVDPIVQ
jgi:hypothetical protein